MADLASLSREELIALIITQQQQIAELRKQVEELRQHCKPAGRALLQKQALGASER